MAFLIQRATARGLTLLRVDVETLRIGRGTNQELRSENPAVALEHAVITSDATGYIVHDRGSITGTYVGGRPVESHRLVKGDLVEIGDLRLDVQMAEAGKPLFLRVTISGMSAQLEQPAPLVPAEAGHEGGGAVSAPVIDYAAAYRLRRPWLTKLTVTAILLIVAFTVIGEVILRPDKQELMMPGGVSSAHLRAKDTAGNVIATRCDACHTPWKSVTSAKCAACHEQPPHAKHATTVPECFACHAEHRGATRLADIEDSSCTGCHADLGNEIDGAGRESLTFAGGRYGFEEVRRVAEFGTSHPDFRYPPDDNTLRFNHAVHLEGKRIFDATGRRETLQCTSCHALAAGPGGGVDPAPVTFVKHCQRCHLLTFDRRLPHVQVPHGGDAGIVYGFVVAAQRGAGDLVGKSSVEARRILATQRTATPDQRALASAELVFKTRCSQCHQIVSRDGRSEAVAPRVRLSWLDRSAFTHGPHRKTPCETCHGSARSSRATADVLMPQTKHCTGCHGPGPATGRGSSCLTCHEYHFSKQTI